MLGVGKGKTFKNILHEKNEGWDLFLDCHVFVSKHAASIR